MTRLALIGVLCLVGCDDPRLRPIDPGSDATDDTDDPWVEPDPEPRDGCLDGALDEGWQTDFQERGPFRSVAGERIVFRGNNAEVRSIAVDSWEGADYDSDTILITERAIVQSKAFASIDSEGLLVSRDSRDGSKREARLWFDNRGFNEPLPVYLADVEIIWQPTSRTNDPGVVAAGDVDGDGLDDLVFTDRVPNEDRGVILGPIPSGVSRDDAELNQVGRGWFDWNDDGYADTAAYDSDRDMGIYLGPLYGVRTDEPPDLTWTGPSLQLGIWEQTFGGPPSDLDGDGILEIWARSPDDPNYYSVNFPGTGAFDTRDSASIWLLQEEPFDDSLEPLIGDYNGDGHADVVQYATQPDSDQPRLQFLAGPLPAGETLWSTGSFIDLPADRWGGPLNYMGDVNSDGLDDFVVAGDIEPPRLFLGCPGW